MRQNTQQQIAIEVAQPHSKNLPKVQKCDCVGAGLDNFVIRFADNQQRTVRLNRACEMNLFPFAIRKIGFSERWGGVGMQRQLNPLGFPRCPTPYRQGRND